MGSSANGYRSSRERSRATRFRPPITLVTIFLAALAAGVAARAVDTRAHSTNAGSMISSSEPVLTVVWADIAPTVVTDDLVFEIGETELAVDPEIARHIVIERAAARP